jgi:hypothetical protein
MLKLSDMKPLEGIYTFIDSKGVNINIASNRLHDWCLKHALHTVHAIPVRRDLAEKFLHDNTISLDRCKTLVGRYLKRRDIEPVIMCFDGTSDANGPFAMLVDGHHRYFIAASIRAPAIAAFCLDPIHWKPFQIEDLPAMTEQQLKDIPPGFMRNY